MRLHPMPPRLKVFVTRIGFFDVAVAASSQKAALAAWDVRDNLFAAGAASPTDDPAAVEPALASPGQVLRRPAGSNEPFRADAEAALPDVPASPARKRTPAKPPPDRTRLDAAERALAALQESSADRLAELERERAALEAREAALRAELDRERRALEAERAAARAAYRKAGGTP